MAQKSSGKKRAILSPEEKAIFAAFNKRIRELSKPSGSDLRLAAQADLTQRYSSILKEVKAYAGPFDGAAANKVHAAVFKSLPKLPRKFNSKVDISSQSVEAACEVLAEDVKRAFKTLRDERATESLLKRATGTVLEFVRAQRNVNSWAAFALFLQTATGTINSRIESFVSESSLGPNYQVLKEGFVRSIEEGLQTGETTGVGRILSAFSRHSEFDELFKNLLEQLITSSAATLPRESQQLVMRTLGLGNASEKVEFANPAESPEIKKAAALLLYLFDFRARGPELEEAYDRYVDVAQNQFNLYLRGMGASMAFDARLHEPPESDVPERPITVVRPWVEWYRPPDARVVIRGMVE